MDGKQLKNSILQWAIQGKLVPQNPKDEPASKLLERIAASRNGVTACHPERNAVKSKDLKKKKSAPTSRIYRENGVWYEQLGNAEPIDISEDIPFEIPENWAWTRVSQVMDVKGGKRIPLGSSWTKEKTDHIYIRVTDMKNGTIVDRDLRYITNNIYEKIKNYTISKHDLYITVAGTIGAVGDVPEKFDGMNLTENANKLTDIGADKDYIVKCFSSPFVQSQFKALTNQMAQPKLSIRNVLTTLFPLPPLAEQKRIVAKLEQVLPLADEYGAAQEQLDKLNKELPEALKKSILQQAIQGKLVPQNPKDEPAQKLLEKVRDEREILVKQGKLKKKDLKKDPISEEEIPFDLPSNWEWARIEDLFFVWSARRVHEKDWRTKGIPFYRAREIGKLADYGVVDNDLFIERSLYDEFSSTGIPKKNDLMITAVGTLGKVFVVKDDNPFYFKDGSVLCMRNDANVDPRFFKYCIESQFFKDQYVPESGGTTVATLTMVRFNKYLVPLPPLAEQKRIVTKLEQLFKVL